ncbi:FG-GAP repeat domain-containing protein [Crassaminicella indica]|uniref:VCBS repeat-containing protein n=1 Tax=Crassaminicella indica TaxID=2855394 RepID=A0ABX8RDE8_9CLOT|nr:VCBS repeat-containing protein [Crassaminicella indica]QXM07095.1 VCBS repeat-containing protein [Crassaminicella indica]
MKKSFYISHFVRNALAPAARIIRPENPKSAEAIQTEDLDGDGKYEIIATYELYGEMYVMILKEERGKWYKLTIKGAGSGIDYMNFADITGKGKKDLLIGWQIGNIWNELDLYTWEKNTMKRIVHGLSYSKVDIFDRLEQKSVALALWSYTTGDVYDIQLVYWDGRKLAHVKDSRDYYTERVVPYYEQKVKDMPKSAFYWYYLADAQINGGTPKDALKSIVKGMALNEENPSKGEFLALRKKAKRNLIQ